MDLDILTGGIVLVALVLAIRVKREDIPALARQFARWLWHDSNLPLDGHLDSTPTNSQVRLDSSTELTTPRDVAPQGGIEATSEPSGSSEDSTP